MAIKNQSNNKNEVKITIHNGDKRKAHRKRRQYKRKAADSRVIFLPSNPYIQTVAPQALPPPAPLPPTSLKEPIALTNPIFESPFYSTMSSMTTSPSKIAESPFNMSISPIIETKKSSLNDSSDSTLPKYLS